MKNKITYLSERLFPLASRVAKVASIAISITAFIPAAQMSLDYLPSALVVPSSIGYGLGFVFMDYLPMRELLEDLMHLGLGYLGNDFQKEHIKIHQKLISVKSLIENADKKAVAKLLVKLYSNPHIQTALRKHQVNMQELASYIDLEKIDIDEAV